MGEPYCCYITKMSLRPEVVVIGGGTGTSTLLSELMRVSESLTAVVNMFDSGGSSETIAEGYQMGAPGDITQCGVAMGTAPAAQHIASQRFASGPFKGHTVRNIMLAAEFEKNGGDIDKAVDAFCAAMGVTGQDIPIVTDRHTLVLRDGDTIIHRESTIGEHAIRDPNARIKLEPAALLNPRASEAIERADLVVIAPGSVYTSILPCLAVGGMAEALQATKAKIVAITNLVSTPGQTDGWHITDYVDMYERYIGGGVIDRVLYNTEAPSDQQLAKYAAEGEYPVRADPEEFRDMLAVAIGAPLVAREVFSQDPNDTLIRRTLIRHDAAQVCRQLMRIYYED